MIEQSDRDELLLIGFLRRGDVSTSYPPPWSDTWGSTACLVSGPSAEGAIALFPAVCATHPSPEPWSGEIIAAYWCKIPTGADHHLDCLAIRLRAGSHTRVLGVSGYSQPNVSRRLWALYAESTDSPEVGGSFPPFGENLLPAVWVLPMVHGIDGRMMSDVTLTRRHLPVICSERSASHYWLHRDGILGACQYEAEFTPHTVFIPAQAGSLFGGSLVGPRWRIDDTVLGYLRCAATNYCLRTIIGSIRAHPFAQNQPEAYLRSLLQASGPEKSNVVVGPLDIQSWDDWARGYEAKLLQDRHVWIGLDSDMRALEDGPIRVIQESPVGMVPSSSVTGMLNLNIDHERRWASITEMCHKEFAHWCLTMRHQRGLIEARHQVISEYVKDASASAANRINLKLQAEMRTLGYLGIALGVLSVVIAIAGAKGCA